MNQNFNDPQHPWSRLTAAAREVRDERDATPSYGFATRVVALAFAQQEQRVASLLERVAFRAVGVASMLALFSVALNYQALSPAAGPVTTAMLISPQFDVADLVAVDDAVSIVLDFAD